MKKKRATFLKKCSLNEKMCPSSVEVSYASVLNWVTEIFCRGEGVGRVRIRGKSERGGKNR